MPVAMRPGFLRTSLRFLTSVCVVLLAVLSLMPAEKIEAVRTDLPGQVEHIIAYAGSTAIAVAGYGSSRRATPITGAYWESLGARVLKVRIPSPPAERVCKLSVPKRRSWNSVIDPGPARLDELVGGDPSR